MNRRDDLAIAHELRGAASLVTASHLVGRRDPAVFIDDIVLEIPGLPFCARVNSVLPSGGLRESNSSRVRFGAAAHFRTRLRWSVELRALTFAAQFT